MAFINAITAGGLTKNIPRNVETITTTNTTVTVSPNTKVIITEPIGSLNITLALPTEGIDSEYKVCFSPTSSFTDLIVNAVNGYAVRWTEFIEKFDEKYGYELVFSYQGIDFNLDNELIISASWDKYRLEDTLTFGIMRDIASSSPVWTRTNDAVGLTARASIGTEVGYSDFDNYYPWNEMTRTTLSSGDVMVRIPKFYYQRYVENNIEHIKISDKPQAGFDLHPAFTHNHTTQENIYVGAYKTTANHTSKSGLAPLVNQTRAQFRSGARAKGDGWSQMDFTSTMAVQMLYLVEYADYNSQAKIGEDYTASSHSAAIVTGSCDGMYGVGNHTGRPAGTSNDVDCIYRGVEGFWGNVWEWVDGYNQNSGAQYICNDQANYADDTSTNYTQVGYNCLTETGYPKNMGYDANNPFVMFPVASGGSASTYLCDYYYYNSGWRVCKRGGYWNDGASAGLFYFSVSNASSHAHASIGSRLLWLP